MATPPESTKVSLGQRLRAHARQRWPALAEVTVRHDMLRIPYTHCLVQARLPAG